MNHLLADMDRLMGHVELIIQDGGIAAAVQWMQSPNAHEKGYYLVDLDNYAGHPGADPTFDAGWKNWYMLYTYTTGAERAAVIQLATTLWNNSTRSQGRLFLGHNIAELTRDRVLSKAMCILYRDLQS